MKILFGQPVKVIYQQDIASDLTLRRVLGLNLLIIFEAVFSKKENLQPRYISLENTLKLVEVITCLVLSCLLFSCAPTLRDYHQPKYEIGELTSTGCSGSGSADLLKISLEHNVIVKVRASSSNNLESNNFFLNLTYEVPSNVQIEFNKPVIKVYSEDSQVTKFKIDKLSTPTWDKTYGSYFVSIDMGSKLQGDTIYRNTLFGEHPINRSFYNSYAQKLPEYYSAFEILLPNIIVNGTEIDFSKIYFNNVSKWGVDPLNC